VLKVYRSGWRSADEIGWEVDLLTHLAAVSVAVAAPLFRRDGEYIGTVHAPEGVRCYVLFEYAEGMMASWPIRTAQLEALGRRLPRQSLEIMPLAVTIEEYAGRRKDCEDR
jgi:Ser/Thr protein kinase RdoA (MazF antagonist)